MKLPFPTVSSRHEELYAILSGKQSGKDFYNASGVLLDNGNAFLRIDRVYDFVVMVDGELYKTNTIPSSHPFIAQLELTTFGESPQVTEQKAARKKWASLPIGEAEQALYKSWGCTVTQPGAIPYKKKQPNAPDIPIV